MSTIKKVAVIGTGVIGTGWIIRCLAHGKIVYAFDRDIKLKKNGSSNGVDQQTKALSKMISSNEIVTLINALGLDPKTQEIDLTKQFYL